MNKRRASREVEIDKLAKNLAKLVEIFRQGKWASDFEWWSKNSAHSIFNPYFGYQDGQPLFEEVVQSVLRLNSDMLSQRKTESKIIFDFLRKQTTSLTQSEHLNKQDLVNEAKKQLHELVEFEAWQDIDIPIANLWLEGEPAKLGKVTFMRVTKEELEQWKKQSLWSGRAPDVRVIAQVKAPGDRNKAFSYVRTQVNLVLDVWRAFCFPFGRYSDTWRVGVLGDIIASTEIPMRINKKDFPTHVGASVAQIELRKDILSKLEQPQWERIDNLIQNPHPSKMENKLLLCIHWLGESTKPDTNNSKFAKISIALEALLGSEPKQDEELKVRGITAMLAERAAFIAGKDLDDRLKIDNDIRNYYGMRSGVFHGGEDNVSLDDIDEFGQLVRRLALALLEKLNVLGDEISDVDKLAKWVRVQKYTLPEHNTKEVS